MTSTQTWVHVCKKQVWCSIHTDASTIHVYEITPLGTRYSELELRPGREVRTLVVDVVRRLHAVEFHLRHDDIGLLEDPQHVAAREAGEVVLVPAAAEEDLELRGG
jgi:hypothetical protein